MSSSVSVEVKNLASPDASWAFLDGSERVAVVLSSCALGRGVYLPGWRWSEHARPLSEADSAEHIGYVISGRMAVRSRDGLEVEVGPGEAFLAAPGHDAWVLGDEPCVALDFVPAALAEARKAATGEDRKLEQAWPCSPSNHVETGGRQ